MALEIAKSAKIVGCAFYVEGVNNSIHIGEKVILRNSTVEVKGNNCQLIIGDNCMIGDNCYLSIKESTSLVIQNNCGLSRNVKIMTSDGHPIFKDQKRINNAKNIQISKNVWLADNVTIQKVITIGEGSVVGINSTVTKDVPSNIMA